MELTQISAHLDINSQPPLMSERLLSSYCRCEYPHRRSVCLAGQISLVTAEPGAIAILSWWACGTLQHALLLLDIPRPLIA